MYIVLLQSTVLWWKIIKSVHNMARKQSCSPDTNSGENQSEETEVKNLENSCWHFLHFLAHYT